MFSHRFPEVNTYLQVGFLPRLFYSQSHIWFTVESNLFASPLARTKATCHFNILPPQCSSVL